MNNQYSRGCSYNYRRSAQRDMNMTRSVSSCNSMQNAKMMPSACCSAETCKPGNLDMGAEGACGRSKEEYFGKKSLAMGYVPEQKWSEPLSVCQGLKIGTIFADLHKPFCGKGGLCR